MENKKSFYIYYFIAVLMMFFPLTTMFTFIPLVIVYKKYDYKRYFNLAIFITILSLLTFRSFSSLMPFLVSYIIIKGLKKDKKGYEIVFLSGVCASFLSLLDFSFINLYSKNYIEILQSVNSSFSTMGVKNVDVLNLKKTISIISDFYPAIIFFIFYCVLSFGYLFLHKRYFEMENKSEDIVTVVNYKLILFFAILYILLNIFKVDSSDFFYKIYLLYINIVIILFIIFTVEGFIVFNFYLKKKLNNIMANVLSFVSLFLVFSYFLYLLYGSYNSIIRGVKNEKNIN